MYHVMVECVTLQKARCPPRTINSTPDARTMAITWILCVVLGFVKTTDHIQAKTFIKHLSSQQKGMVKNSGGWTLQTFRVNEKSIHSTEMVWKSQVGQLIITSMLKWVIWCSIYLGSQLKASSLTKLGMVPGAPDLSSRVAKPASALIGTVRETLKLL